MWTIRMDDRSKLERYLLIVIHLQTGMDINFRICQALAWKIQNHSAQLVEVCSPDLVVLFSIQDRIPSLWEGWAWRRRVGEAAQHVIYIPAEDKKKKDHIPLILPVLLPTPAEGVYPGFFMDEPTWWTPGRSGKRPLLPCADKVVWKTCRVGRHWHWPRAPYRSGSG